jgi:hypothetical protein
MTWMAAGFREKGHHFAGGVAVEAFLGEGGQSQGTCVCVESCCCDAWAV